MTALGNGLAFPLAVDARGGIALARGTDDVDQAIAIVLSTAPGERPMRPEFGCRVHDHLFDVLDAATLGRIETAIRDALDRWEPRVEVVDIAFDLSARHEGRLDVELTYRISDTGTERNLVHPFYVIPEEEHAP
jgi:phage baseplate assembly protein W